MNQLWPQDKAHNDTIGKMNTDANLEDALTEPIKAVMLYELWHIQSQNVEGIDITLIQNWEQEGLMVQEMHVENGYIDKLK